MTGQFLDWSFSDDLSTAVNLKKADVVHFTRAERSLLAALLSSKGSVLTREHLLDAVAGTGSDSSDRSIDFLINRLRRKLGDPARRPQYVESRYGEGYRWIAASCHRTEAEHATLAPVRSRLRGDRIMSYCDRPEAERSVLQRHAETVLVLRLQGFLVAESADRLLDEVRQEAGCGLRHLIIDFRDVQGIDEPAMAALACLHRLTQDEGVELVFSSIRQSLRPQLQTTDVCLFPSLDQALEWREEAILADQPPSPAEHCLDRLLAQEAGAGHADTVMRYLDAVVVPPRSVIIPAGSETREMFFLESGRAEVLLVVDDAWVRASRIWPGTLFGEIGFHCGGPRTATILSVDDCRLVQLAPDAMDRLEADAPRAAIALHRFLERRAARRLLFYNDMIIDLFRSTTF